MTKRTTPEPLKARPRNVAAPLRQRSSSTGTRELAALFERVVAIIEDARTRVVRTVSSAMVVSYWYVGRELVEYVQRGSARAEYGEEVIEDVSQQLLPRVGRGCSTTNLRYFRTFYLAYRDRRLEIRHIGSGESESEASIAKTRKNRHKRGGVSLETRDPVVLDGFSPSLGWTHYRALMKVEPAAARTFYEGEAERESWSVLHPERQILTQLHLRLLKSRNKEGVLALDRKWQTVEQPSDVIKSPVILDFLGLPDRPKYRERDLEMAGRSGVWDGGQ